jgi:hypothetical protein
VSTAKPYTKPEPLWMVTRPRVGDILVRWEDLSPAEQEAARRHHVKIYGSQT